MKQSLKSGLKPRKIGFPLPKSQLDFEFFLLHGTWWKIEGISPLCQKIRTIEFTLKISSRSKITRLHADLNPLFKTQKNLPFGENWERFYARWRERAREIPGARIHPYNMLLLTLTKSKQQRMDEHENSVIKRCENADYEIFHFYIQDFKILFLQKLTYIKN